jgi:transcriptional regulator with XRE-family HTH domain
VSEKTEQLGRVIAKARKTKGLSQKELAVKAGYDASGVSITRIETGAIRRPSNEKLDRLAAALDLSADRLRQLADEAATRGPLHGPAAHKANQQRIKDLNESTEELQRAVDAAYSPLIRVRQEVEENFLTPLFELSQCVRGVRLTGDGSLVATERSDNGDDTVRDAADDYFERVRANFAGHFAAGAAAGGAFGAGAAFATYSAVGAFATASTGTAISGLSGAAATNATLAAIGGGSLATGGGGIAVGTAVLGAMVAAPVLLVGGVGLVLGGKKLSAHEDTLEQRLQLAENTFEANSRRIRDSFDRAGQAQAVLTLAAHRGASRLQALHAEGSLSEATPEAPVDWDDDLSAEARGTLSELAELAALTLSVLPLPSVPAPAEDLSPDEVRDVEKAAREWDQTVLHEALARFAA